MRQLKMLMELALNIMTIMKIYKNTLTIIRAINLNQWNKKLPITTKI